MAVKIGHARIDERGKTHGGQAGDQNGQEVMVSNWYNKPWDLVIRPKNSSDAEAIAKAMEQACANNHIGYNQYNRVSLYDEASKYGFDISKVTKNVDTDCSALVAVCVNAAGIKVDKKMYTGNEHGLLKNTGKFDILTDGKYVQKEDYLRRGDILLKKHSHTAIVLTNGKYEQPKHKTVACDIPAKYGLDGNFKSTFVTTGKVNMRNDAGKSKKILTVLPKGSKVECGGYYNVDPSTKRPWLLVTYKNAGTNTTYIGYVSTMYLKKQ